MMMILILMLLILMLMLMITPSIAPKPDPNPKQMRMKTQLARRAAEPHRLFALRRRKRRRSRCRPMRTTRRGAWFGRSCGRRDRLRRWCFFVRACIPLARRAAAASTSVHRVWMASTEASREERDVRAKMTTVVITGVGVTVVVIIVVIVVSHQRMFASMAG
jgi:hypothetical protein